MREETPSEPNNVWLWEALAEFLWRFRGKTAEANDCFQKALALDPGNDAATGIYAEFLKVHPQFAKWGTLVCLCKKLLPHNHGVQTAKVRAVQLRKAASAPNVFIGGDT